MEASMLSVLHAVTKDQTLDDAVRKAASNKMLALLSDGSLVECTTAARTTKKPSFVMALVRSNPDHAFGGDVNLTGGAKGKVADLMHARAAAARAVLVAAVGGDARAAAMVGRAYAALGLPTPDAQEVAGRLERFDADRDKALLRKRKAESDS